MRFPLVVCNGMCGTGKARTLLKEVPFFHAKMFSATTEALWEAFLEVSHFQPEHIFLSEEFPLYSSSNSILSCVDTPVDLVSSIQRFLKDPSLDKVVLAKKRTIIFKDPLEPLSIISTLINTFPKDRVFAFMPDPLTLFFGTTPENLFVRKKDHISVDCIAGTVLEGDEESLFTSKLVKEHGFVREFVQRKLSPFLVSQKTSDLGVKSAGNVSHLYQTVSGILHKDVTDQQLLNALHKTPATLGHPSFLAQQFLNENEPFDRGMYAGVCGWMSEEMTTLKVCIRSGLVHKNTLSLFAGAGITKESIAEDEVQEINNKFKTLEEVFLERTMSQ